MSFPQASLSATNRSGSGVDLLAELDAAWRKSDELFGLADGAWMERPIPLRHPLLFYVGHLPAFAWNQIARGVLGRPSFRADFDELFERGIDPLDEAEAARVAIHDWPSISETLAYRDRVRDELREAVDDVATLGRRDVMADRLRVYQLVLEHELMHHETLFYMLHELDPAKKQRPADAPALEFGSPPEAERVAIPSGTVNLGADFDEVSFGWDNEFPRHTVPVEAFELDRRPVCVASFREFVAADGYSDERWWSDADHAWLQAQRIRAPHAWRRRAGEWAYRTFFEEVSLDDVAAWPALVSGAEAQAYCRWRGERLPTEAELQWAAYGAAGGAERPYPWGAEPPTAARANLDFHSFDPLPVGSRPAGRSAFGVDELVGNGWEWTSTDFGPFEGFEPWARTYPGYSQDFFTGKHAVVFGASWATAARLTRPSFRNWFQRHYRYVPATFRCAR